LTEREWVWDSNGKIAVPVGEPGIRQGRLVCRELVDESGMRVAGSGLPSSVEGTDGVAVRVVASQLKNDVTKGTSPRTRYVGNARLVEHTVFVTAELPPRLDTGIQGGSLLLSWDDGYVQRYPVSWTVQPIVRVLPPGIFLRGGQIEPDGRIELRFQVDGKEPVRILGIEGEHPGIRVTSELPTGRAFEHTVGIAVD
jgi:hypothetical protein